MVEVKQSIILWFSVARRSIIRLWRIIDLQDYFAITEFNNCFIIGSMSLFFNEYLREVKCSATFMQGQSQEGEKCSFIFIRISRILFAAKHSWTTLHMSRLLFVSSYLQVTWWPLDEWKGRKICIEWLVNLAGLFSVEVYFQLFDSLAILLHFQLLLKACSTVINIIFIALCYYMLCVWSV